MEAQTTNNRRRGDSTLLVSFCNIGKSSLSVAAIDLREQEPVFRWVDIKGGAHTRGARGLCFWNGLVCVGHQPGPKNSPPPGFVLLDPDRDFKQVGEGVLPSTPHSVCARNGELLFTMSKEDSVYKARYGRWRGWEVSHHWTFPGSSGTDDENHVNAIEIVNGNLCISATGKKEKGSELWSSAKRGFVYDLDRTEYLMHDIRQPHSLLEDSGAVWTCETRGSRVLSNTGEEYRFPSDPTRRVRGLAMNEEYLYVGISKNRIGSKSLGSLRGYEGVCRIYRFARGSEEPELLMDLSQTRDEIYELMLV